MQLRLRISDRELFSSKMSPSGTILANLVATHHKANLTDVPGGRPPGALTNWVYTPMLKTYGLETMKKNTKPK